MTMAELMELGAPKLPDEMFYRIKVDYDGRIYVQIREDRKRFGSRVLESHFWYADECSLAEMCMKCFELFEKKHAERIEIRAKYAAIDKFVGDHR